MPTAMAALSVVPLAVEDDDAFDAAIARAVDALDARDVAYETHAMETTVVARDLATLFDACRAAVEAADCPRVYVDLSVDFLRDGERTPAGKVDAVRERLGRDPRSADDGGREAPGGSDGRG